jgi:hypothetical protein
MPHEKVRASGLFCFGRIFGVLTPLVPAVDAGVYPVSVSVTGSWE